MPLTDYINIIRQEIRRGAYPYPIEYINAVIIAESGGIPGNIQATSGASGLMQVMPIALRDYNQRNKTEITMADMRGVDENSIRLQIRVGLATLGMFWRGAYNYVTRGGNPITLEDLAKFGQSFYVFGPGNIKPMIDQLGARPTFAAFAKRFSTWKSLPYVQRIWKNTQNAGANWDLPSVAVWVRGPVEGVDRPNVIPPISDPLIAQNPKKGIAIALIGIAIASYYMK